MKKAILTLAALLALSGAAFADSNQSGKQEVTCIDTKTGATLDCAPTGSLEKADAAAHKAGSKGPRLGIGIDPWIVPSSF
ncbi:MULTISPECIES: DUF680 domain-containing protein [unclassified Mesorhizobium]|uniref:DUF680 domain-containing protein n=1 Tax=unclassified Mesorhizobium TaxID=325217 RepID=UPI003337F0DC